MSDVYANVVSTIAAVMGGWALGWQIKANWWNRPNVVFEDDRVAGASRWHHDGSGRTFLGWEAQVTISNTGDVETTLVSLEWEFDRAPERGDSIFVAGNAVDPTLTVTVTDISPGVQKKIIGPDDGDEFQPVVLGRNHSKQFVYRVGPLGLEGHLGKSTRARPIVRFIDRKRTFGPKRHGVSVVHGDWTLAPSERPSGSPLPPGIRAEE
ncbi:hypothetical protein [Mycolicibacterium sp. YH-1]|uniref:hypothetical protein n=1 Tax=Mycolicibacterium sp. YH-1 TaxID=2908837 RepID=UPI001F4C2186|nr:hypothetical protein [Mycolicibacterium sp. YH-1]UNB55481.1 hypothetical protein L0M16_14910 [Mycolicibacterium sp. YH-1]